MTIREWQFQLTDGQRFRERIGIAQFRELAQQIRFRHPQELWFRRTYRLPPLHELSTIADFGREPQIIEFNQLGIIAQQGRLSCPRLQITQVFRQLQIRRQELRRFRPLSVNQPVTQH